MFKRHKKTLLIAIAVLACIYLLYVAYFLYRINTAGQTHVRWSYHMGSIHNYAYLPLSGERVVFVTPASLQCIGSGGGSQWSTTLNQSLYMPVLVSGQDGSLLLYSEDPLSQLPAGSQLPTGTITTGTITEAYVFNADGLLAHTVDLTPYSPVFQVNLGEGFLLVASVSGEYRAVDFSGNEIWKHIGSPLSSTYGYGPYGIGIQLLMDNEQSAYFMDGSTLTCISGAGEVIYTIPFGSSLNAGPMRGETIALSKRALYCLDAGSTLHKISEDGSVAWKANCAGPNTYSSGFFGGFSYSNPGLAVDSNGTSYVLNNGSELVCVDNGGKITWRKQFEGYCSNIICSDSRIYLVSDKSGLTALSNDGKHLWHNPKFKGHNIGGFGHNGLQLVDGLLYALEGTVVNCLDP